MSETDIEPFAMDPDVFKNVDNLHKYIQSIKKESSKKAKELKPVRKSKRYKKRKVTENNPIIKREVPHLIISDFRSDAGEVSDVISFQKEFLNRKLSNDQREAYLATWGNKGGEYCTKYNEIVLYVGMKGGKNFWIEGDVAYFCYFVSMLKDPHNYFTKLTKRSIPYPITANFDVPFVTPLNEAQLRFVTFYSIHRVIKATKDPMCKCDNWFEKYVGLDLREVSGDLTRNEIVFPTKKKRTGMGGIRLFGYHSKPSAAEGLHMIRFYADELSRTKTKNKYRTAQKLLDLGLFNTSVSFPNGVGKVIEASYANDTKYDLTEERYNKSLEVDCIYGLKSKTIEFNPTIKEEMLIDCSPESTTYKINYECDRSELIFKNK